jgi:glutamate/tyrosine decarboxylase-like PLP-dependent enzyme
MSDPLGARDEVEEALELAASEAASYLQDIGDSHVLRPGSEELVRSWREPLPEEGNGTLPAVEELASRGQAAATRSSGPRFFHFVMGGGTPAALAADWLTSVYDQSAYSWAASAFASGLEQIAVDWLGQLFELPESFGGVLVTGATMANFVGLTAARSWWADRLGFDVDEQGLADLPAPTILSSGYIHPSAVQAIGMLGLGRANIQRFARDGVGRLDVEALRERLDALEEPAVVIANAGEVNTGDFDPLLEMVELAEAHDAWLHVDGAFGLFARLAPATRHLVEGLERVDSIAADGHKWLNVPYDCGFTLVREPLHLARALNVGAAYLPSPDDPHPNMGFTAPENSRRARALAVWATLHAYGRSGYREMVERHLALAQHLAQRVDATPELERLADVPLNIVCFRARPNGVPEEQLDDLNRELGAELLQDGRVFAGTTVYEGKVAFRPAIVNWRTTERDVDLLIDVLLELGRKRTGRAG